MHKIIKTICSLAVVVSVTSCDDKADAIYMNGNIITINDNQPNAKALAIKDGVILAVGDNADILNYESSSTKLVDLKGKTVVPGFVDAHSHFSGVGMQAVVANLLPAPDGPVNNIDALQDVMRAYIAKSEIVRNYEVALGFNYDDSQLAEKKHPTRHDLDDISTTMPIVIMHQSGHIGVYNSKALEMAGITAETEDPEGGVIGREEDGKTPNGVMQENAHFNIFYQFIPPFTVDEYKYLLKQGEYQYVSNGFTTIQDGKTDAATLRSLASLAGSIDFKADIISYADIATIGDGDDSILHSDWMSSEYTNRFRIGGVKLTFDGSPQGKTAWFTEPYYVVPDGEDKNYSGYPAFSDEDALKWMRIAYENQWQLLVHTNGDAAIDQLINLVEKLQPTIKDTDHRTVMIHGQYTRYDQVKKLKTLDIFPAVYPMHTFYWGDWHRDSVAGPERAENISPTGWFLDEDMKFTIHSDAPVTFPNSMRILDSAVNRTTRTDKVLGEKHRISVLNGLKAMTIWPAYQHFEEKIKGSLEVGKQADFVILGEDPTKISPKNIKNIKVIETINDGETIFKSS